MKQKSLFGNLPQLNDKMKDVNKKIVEKANKPKARKTFTARGRGGGKSLQLKIQAVIEQVRPHLIDEGLYKLITEEREFKKYMHSIKKNGIAALDTETSGLDAIEDDLAGICLYTPGQKPAYVPVGHIDFNGDKVEGNLPIELVKEKFEQIADTVEFVFHNAKFDMRVIKNSLKMETYLRCKWDTFIAGNLLNETERHGLKQLYQKYINPDDEALSFSSLFDDVPFTYVPIDVGYIYASKDAEMTWNLYEFQRRFLDIESVECKEKGLEKVSYLMRDIEMELVTYLCEMEDTGIPIDDEVAQELSEKYHEKMDIINEQVQEEVSKLPINKLPLELRSKLTNPVNIGSPQQMAIILYDLLGMKSPDRRKPRGTGEDILVELKSKYREYERFIELVLEYRGVKKLLSTYIDKIPKLTKPTTGRVHTEFKQYGAKTGRFSSADPNLQNIPSKNKDIRKMFIPTKGYVLIGADYSQQEPRVLAHLCYVLFKDRKMMDAYISGRDLYAWMASQIYNKPYDECKEFHQDGTPNPEGKQRRESVKSIILGLMYGRGTPSIAEQIGWSIKETERIVDMFFRSFPAVKQVVEYYTNMAQEKGYVETVYGRKRRLPDINLPEYELVELKDRKTPIKDKNVTQHYLNKLKNAYWTEKSAIIQDAKRNGILVKDNGGKIAEAKRQAFNSVIQGSSADITKLAMIKIGSNKRLRELGFRMLLTVHDEIIGEAPKETALESGEIMMQLMIEAPGDKITVPMKVEAEYTDRWFGEDIKKELAK